MKKICSDKTEACLSWLEDPSVFRVNRLDAHSDHICYATENEMLKGETSLRQSLDGSWKFAWSKTPELRPADFWHEDADLSGFGTIQVPGHIELQGYGQRQYINKLYPWDGHEEIHPPQIPKKYNPVGSYVCEFDLDSALRGKRVCISFQGVERAMYVWLNGEFVGFAEDSFTPSEFDLTDKIREKGNRLCVEAYKHSTASWIEDQDFFQFSGIFRSVYLYAKPAISVDDIWLKTKLDNDLSTGRLQMRFLLTGEKDADIYCRITHNTDGVILDAPLTLSERDGYYYAAEQVFQNVHLWDHGTPELYYVVLTVKNSEGIVFGYIPYDIGFRRIEIKDKVIYLNGKRLMLNGINRHEWNPSAGRCISIEDMEKAMDVFRRNGINAVRTCHYPNRTEWYHMCDREGIYMMDENNLESHGTWQKDMTDDPEWNVPASLPEWKECVLDRAVSMFERDKNHVSVLFWSCCNEAYAGEDILAIAEYLRAVDPDRIVHYEGVFHCREFDRISDVESRMYATPAEIREYLENDPQKPYINCEYMHNMGNSLGGLESYIRLGEEFEMYQGGFLWDFMDQALWHENDNGETVLGYGGDFDERPTDYAFCANGMVTADCHEKPAVDEMRYWYLSKAEREAFDAMNEKAEKQALIPERKTKKLGLTVSDGDGSLGVKGEGFEILFSKLEGGPVSLRSDGREWLWRAPRPAYWRAPTENDIGCKFPIKSAVWSAADAWQTCIDMLVEEKSSESVKVTYHYGSAVIPDLLTKVTYTVNNDGTMDVCASYKGAQGRPQLPLFGLRFSTPHPINETCWIGLSGESYPDRYKGCRFGYHHEVPHIEEYLVPQESGNHEKTHYAAFRMGGAVFEIEKNDKPFSFSAIPYTPAQLEQAYHRDELPEPCRTVITVCSAMRGVGGIDTWMTDVEPQYHVSAEQDHTLNFKIRL